MPVETFEVSVPQATLDDLRDRLARVRWPIDPANRDWVYGVERGYLEELVDYWRTQYDWRAQERAINAFSHFRTAIDGIPIHFIHERGRGPNPIPLILSHGWPWTFWDYHKLIGPLTDPAAHGGDPADSFDVVVPSLPGYGFSVPLSQPGIEWSRTADLWVKLMRDELGYDRFAAQGGDWGALVTEQLGHKYAEHLIGIHLGLAIPMTLFITGLPSEEEYAEDERQRFHHTRERMAVGTAHWVVQATDPQTLAYALHDSSVGLCAWILERRRSWSDSGGDVERRFSKDDLLTTTMLYWVSESTVTSMRYYSEAEHATWSPSHDRMPAVEAPTAVTIWPQELMTMPQQFLERYYNLQRTTEMASGGHFHPMEEPELLLEDIRAFFRTLR